MRNRTIVVTAILVLVMASLPFAAYAQQKVDCPTNADEFIELYLTTPEDTFRNIMVECMNKADNGNDSSAGEDIGDTANSEQEVEDEREPVNLTKGVASVVPEDYTCVGDVRLGGQKKFDDDPNTGMVVYLTANTVILSEFSDASCFPGDITADAKAQQLEQGCDADGCGVVNAFQWPMADVSSSMSDMDTSDAMTNTTSSGSVNDLSPKLEPVDVFMQGNWTVYEFRRLRENPIVLDWISRLQDPNPALWPTYPNVQNKLVPSFPAVPCEDNPEMMCVPAGVEYGQDNAPFCQQDSRCDWVVPAWSYRLNSGDYNFQGMPCLNTAEQPQGCLIVLFNVGNQSYTWRNETLDNGQTITGRYWDGDRLEWAVLGLTSHASANMLNFRTVRNANTGDILNSGDGSNAGANCGNPSGCNVVNATIVIHAGDEILAILKTKVSR